VQSPDATLASDTTIAGYLLIATHADHVARTVPVTAIENGQSVPAF
jgi:hypothetical protein